MKNLVLMERDAEYPMIGTLLNVSSANDLRNRFRKAVQSAFDSENAFIPKMPDVFDGDNEWEVKVRLPKQGIRVIDIYETYLY